MDSLESLISTYKPGDAAIRAIQSARVAILVGITGAGKDTIKQQLLSKPAYQEIISHTTRQPRMNGDVMEVDGREYHFIDLGHAIDMLRNKDFIEAKLVHGSVVYGTSLRELVRASSNGMTAITDVDVQGVAEFKALSQAVVALFIIPPSYKVWLERLRQRYSSQAEFESEWPKRRDSAIQELEVALSVPYFHFVLNDDLERAVRVSDEIITRGDTYKRQDDETRLQARQLLDDIKANS